MVLVKNLTQSQINSITDNLRGEVIANADTNRLMFNNGTTFTYLVYSDLNNSITGLSSISATNITGTLQTAAQPNVTSLGTLTGLSSNGIVNIAEHDGTTKGLKLADQWVTSSATQLNYVDTTPGTAEAGKALVTDENNSIVGLSNLETDNLVVNGTLVTASAIELNYTDINTLGVAQPNKALVVDNDRNITNINSIETEHITVNGTLVTASALELNTTDVAIFGTAEASKALIVDANRNIGNLNNVSATTLAGTLQTAAQPNVTSLGTLTGLNVVGPASVSSLTVAGVPLNAFNVGGMKMRVYDNVDFTGSTIKADVVTSVNFTDYVAGELTENYSMEIWGYIKPAFTEDYTFTVNSNDNFRLWINNSLVKVAWDGGDHLNLQTDPIPLQANKWYPVYMQHVQLDGSERFSLAWSSTSQVSQILPGTNMAYDDKQMTVSPSGKFMQDKITLYDGVNSTQSTLSVTGAGELLVNSHSSNVNILGHDGLTKGLKLAGVLVTSTATELNYVDTTAGAAQASKALVLAADRSLSNVGSVLTTGQLGVNTAGTAATKQVDISSATGDCLRLLYDNSTNLADLSVSSDGELSLKTSGSAVKVDTSNSFDVVGHNGVDKGLKLAGVLVTSTAVELNYTDVTPGTAAASKALVLDASKDIIGINVLGAATLNVDNLSAANFEVDTMNTTGNVGINTTSLAFGLQVNEATGNALRLTYNDDTSSTPASKVDFIVDAGNNLQIASSGSVDLTAHNGTDKGLKLGGVLVVSTAAELNYTKVTPGTASANKALVLDASKEVTGITKLTTATASADSVQVTGTVDSTSGTTGSLVTVGGVGVGKSLFVAETATVAGNTILQSNLQVTGPAMVIPVGDTAARPTGAAGQIRYNSETSQFEGFGAGNSWGSLGGVTDVNQDTKILAETSAGANDDNLRFINFATETMRLTKTNLMGLGTTAPSKKLEINSATGDNLRLTYAAPAGSADFFADLLMSETGDLTVATSGGEVNIHTDSSLDVVGHNGTSKGLKLAGVLVTATAAEINYVDTTPGTAQASKALVLDSSKNLSGLNTLSVNTLSLTFDSAVANTSGVPLVITRTTSGVPANGLGVGMSFVVENSANANVELGNANVVASSITSAAESAQYVINLMDNGTLVEAMRLDAHNMYTTQLFETSDRRVKENFEEVSLEETHTRVMELALVDYNYKGQSRTHRGLIAQEVKEIIPAAVDVQARGDIEDFHSVSTREVTNHLVGSVQFLSKKLEEALEKIAALEARLA